MKLEPVYYIDADGMHRWHLVAANNEVIVGSSEGFASKQKAQENYRLVVESDEEEEDGNAEVQ